MNKLKKLFCEKNKNLLAIYFTAGYPRLDNTIDMIEKLDREGVDIIEVGIPFSDPLADGPTIQHTGEKALQNGMNLNLLFKQLQEAKKINTPLVLMGYYNQFLQYGPEKFLDQCKALEISGLILPDLPLDVYKEKYQQMFEKRDICISFLITPRTSESRVREIAAASTGFLYMVSSTSTTGAKMEIDTNQMAYFKRIKEMNLSNIRLIGFGISDAETYQTACKYANGAIIGSAFLNAIQGENLDYEIKNFIQAIRG